MVDIGTDGDTIFGLSTGRLPLPDGDDVLIRSETSRASMLAGLLTAAAEVFAVACVDAIVHAHRLGDPPAYVELCPTAVRT